MSSDDELVRALSGSSSGDGGTPTHNSSWPGVDPFAQALIEHKFFEDGATVHFDRLPKVQTWGPWLLIRERFYVLSVLKKVTNHAVGAQRRLTATEVDAVSEHAAKTVRQFAWTQPMSIAFAAGLAWSRRRTFKFPFYQPKMRTFDPLAFPTRTMPLIRGPRAVATWHFLRFLAYCPLCWVSTALFLTSTSESSFRARMMRDPRLSGLIHDITRSQKELQTLALQEQRRRLGIPDPPGQGQTTVYRRPDGVSSSKAPRQTTQPQYSGPKDHGDGAFASNGDTFENPNPTVGKASSATQSSWARSSPPQAPPGNPQGADYPEHSSQHAADESDLFDDDASPIAPSARRVEANQSPSVSSWERIRQQAQSGAQKWERGDSSGQESGWAQLRQDKTRNARETSPKSDDFAYSKQDEEREKQLYEKEQAQKEFDALVEAERHGESSDNNWRRSK
ncbi:hypothetical protein F5X99DRAFT_391623 [Biscogniauxia marginata]|nr:hypothetical protein F5X99DRAFT_391623 [Biscogniauxia marginata]